MTEATKRMMGRDCRVILSVFVFLVLAIGCLFFINLLSFRHQLTKLSLRHSETTEVICLIKKYQKANGKLPKSLKNELGIVLQDGWEYNTDFTFPALILWDGRACIKYEFDNHTGGNWSLYYEGDKMKISFPVPVCPCPTLDQRPENGGGGAEAGVKMNNGFDENTNIESETEE